MYFMVIKIEVKRIQLEGRFTSKNGLIEWFSQYIKTPLPLEGLYCHCLFQDKHYTIKKNVYFGRIVISVHFKGRFTFSSAVYSTWYII